MKQLIAMLLALVLALAMCACGVSEEKHDSETDTEEQKTIRTVADPKGALKEIYSNLERKTGLVDADDSIVSDVMGFDLESIDEYHIRYMETDYGASDVYIIKPTEGEEETVREAMKEWQESRIRAFSGYDIYNSTAISENAMIFRRGNYLVMLMLEDNEAARRIIDEYIPEELNLEN